jgi:hypothetical protein
MRPRHRLVDLPQHADQRGALVFGQEGDHVPFPVKRFFTVFNVAPGATRADHAHRKQHQFLLMPAGAATAIIEDGENIATVRLDRPNLALHSPPMLWVTLKDFTPGAVCLVLSSGVYDESDYIRDRDTFLRLAKAV